MVKILQFTCRGEGSLRKAPRVTCVAYGPVGEQLDDGGVAGLDELGGVLGGLAGALLHILQDLGELGDT